MRNDTVVSTAPDQGTHPSRSRTRAVVTSLLWAGHWLLRLWLAGYLLIYGWSKIFHMQMWADPGM